MWKQKLSAVGGIDGIRLRTGQRRKSVARRKHQKQAGFDLADDMFTFAEMSLRPERHLQIFARKFSQLRYCAYKQDDEEEDNVSRSSFSHSICSSRSNKSALHTPDDISDYNELLGISPCATDDVVNKEAKSPRRDVKGKRKINKKKKKISKVISDDRIKSGLEPKVVDVEVKDDVNKEQTMATLQVAQVAFHKDDSVVKPEGDNALRIPGETNKIDDKVQKEKEGATDTDDTITDGSGKGQIVELQVEGVRKASIKLPPITFKNLNKRKTEMNIMSRKNAQDSLRKEASFSSCDSPRERSFYKSEVASSLSSEVSLTFERSDTTSSDEEEGPPNISDSEAFDTDLELDDLGRDNIPENDAHVGKTVYQRMCERLGKPPQKYILKCLPERSMTLRNRSLGKDGIAPLCEALKDNLRVERINLDGTDITEEGIHYVSDMLLENVTISHLSLANNSLGLKTSMVISHVITATKYLSHLNLSGNKMKDDASFHLTSGISSNNSITHLDLGYNEFGEKAGIFFSSGLVRNNKLLYLSLRWNNICGKGAVAIFQALMLNNTVEVLDFSWNGMGYPGAVAMSKCLKTNRGLRSLDVSNNRLGYTCCPLMAAGLRSNFTLRQLKIACNPLSTTGCTDILEAVANDESGLSFLDCSEIPVLGEADLIAATISRRRKFLFIHGGIVPTHDKIGQKIGRERNPMVRIIEYLRLLGLRPLELMKSFNKTASFELPRQEFVAQIKRIGVKLHVYEIEALANSISGKGYNKNVINYRKLSMAVREVVQAERERKLREREEWIQMKKQHEKILKRTQLEIDSNTSQAKVLSDLDSLRVTSFNNSSLMATSRESFSSKASARTHRGAADTVPDTMAPTAPMRSPKQLTAEKRTVSFALQKKKPAKKVLKKKRPAK